MVPRESELLSLISTNPSNSERGCLTKKSWMSSESPTPNPSRKLPKVNTARRLTLCSFKHGVIRDLVSPELLRSVRSEIRENLSFTPKETDIYKIHQSGDLANLDGLDDSSLKLLPSLLTLRDSLYSSAFRDYLSTITGSGPLSGRKTDMAINVYTPGCHLLCHDDVIGSRRVSYILYLTDPDRPWREEWGGALRLYPTVTYAADDGKTVKVPSPDHDVLIPPAFNQLSFFAVQPGESFHDVEEVYASLGGDDEAKDEIRVRTAISGWYHIPQEGEVGFVDGLEEKLAEKSSLTQLQGNVDSFDLPKMNIQPPNLSCHTPFGTNGSAKMQALGEEEDVLLSEDDLNFLIKYISPTYLTPDNLESVSDEFGEEFSLTLDAFLAPRFLESLWEFISTEESQPLATETTSLEKTTSWMVARPPHKHRFLFQQVREIHNSDPRSQSPLQDLLENLLPSLPFYKWLQLATGQTVSCHNLLARRFRRGKDYTLATGYDEEDPRLEITLAITPSVGWEPDRGDEDADENEDEVYDEDAQESTGHDAAEKPNKSVEEKTADVGEAKTDEGAEERIDDAVEVKTGGGVEDKVDEEVMKKSNETAEENAGKKPKAKTHDGSSTLASDDVGGYVVYMAGDDDVDDGGPDREGHDQGLELPLDMSTGARASGFSSSKGHKQVKADPAIYRSSGQGDGDDHGVLISMPAGWNRLGIVLRDKGVMQFVKYVSRQAKGDRWDVRGEYGVIDQDEGEGEELDVNGSGMDVNSHYVNEEGEEEESETSDEY